MPILNWLGRDEALKTANKTPYRLLEEVPELGYGDKTKENMIVQGDNLEALKALLPFYAGQVKCSNKMTGIFNKFEGEHYVCYWLYSG